jgi:hypothetical protein
MHTRSRPAFVNVVFTIAPREARQTSACKSAVDDHRICVCTRGSVLARVRRTFGDVIRTVLIAERILPSICADAAVFMVGHIDAGAAVKTGSRAAFINVDVTVGPSISRATCADVGVVKIGAGSTRGGTCVRAKTWMRSAFVILGTIMTTARWAVQPAGKACTVVLPRANGRARGVGVTVVLIAGTDVYAVLTVSAVITTCTEAGPRINEIHA